jgi:pimeloyl-ACP methyl ester carboxylesterase
MFRGQRRTWRFLVPALVAGLLSSCGIANQPPAATPPPTAGAPPSGVRDPATDPALARFYGQRLAWHGCSDGFECARLSVPVDWAAPTGQTAQLDVVRLPASGRRIGSLMVNPGGPGASGVEFARAARRVYGSAVLQRFDVVGWDPRGIGPATAIKCLSDAELDRYVAEDGTPDTPAELAHLEQTNRDFALACERNSGPIFRHVDTLSTVKDMDVLRAALGESTLTFHGASYGTFLGAWYAQEFPWRVGRLYLDGAIDPSLTSAQYLAGQAEGFSRTLRAYVAHCESQPDCPVRGTVEEGLRQIGLLVDHADQQPLRTTSGRPLTQALMTTGIAQALYLKDLWPVLTTALTDAMAGDGTALLRLADAYQERDARGHYGETISANPAIFCLDVAETRTPAQIVRDAQDLQRRFPPLGGVIGWAGLGCAGWPVQAVVPRQKLSATGAAPILVAGTLGDPATPYEWAQGLAGQLSSARLLTWRGAEHTAYGKGSSCIDSAVEAYLLRGVLPAPGTSCR